MSAHRSAASGHRRRSMHLFRRMMLLNIILLVGLVTVTVAAVRETPEARAEEQDVGVGAAALVDSAADLESLRPVPADATADQPDTYDEGCHSKQDAVDVVSCTRGDPTGALTLAVVGDSKIAQWIPALDEIGQREGWRVMVYTKSNCAFSAALVQTDDGLYEECEEWGREVLEELTTPGTVDVVLTSSVSARASLDGAPSSTEGLVEGYVRYWQQLADADVTVIALSDTPGTGGEDAYVCVMENPENPSVCDWPFADGSGSEPLRLAAAATGAAYVQMNDRVCPHRRCVAVVGDVLTYRQGSHITATYAGVLANALGDRLRPVIENRVTS